jgi:hypothetical protein
VYVDLGGYARFVPAYGSDALGGGNGVYDVAVDANLDGFVDNFDLAAFVQSFGVEWRF